VNKKCCGWKKIDLSSYQKLGIGYRTSTNTTQITNKWIG
jgi:hypothetical protein